MKLQFTLALRYLKGRMLRTVLTTLAIVFGVMIIFGMNSILPSIIEAFQANAMAAAQQYDVTISSKTGDAFSQDAVDQVRGVEGVRVASGVLERSISLPQDYFDQDPAQPDRASAVTLVGIDPDVARAVNVFVIMEGRYLEKSDRNAAVISESLADIAGVQLNDAVTLPTATGAVDLTIVGILPQRLVPGNEEIFVNLQDAQALFAMPGKINTIQANFDTLDRAARQSIEYNITERLGSTFFIGALPQNAEILSNIYISTVVFNLLGALALLMGAFIIFNTFRTVVVERRRDIGMLRSIGAERKTIAWMILIEGLIQGVLGTALGLLLGYITAQSLISTITPILQQFINIQMQDIVIQPALVAVSTLAGVGVTVLAGLLPARAASRISPLEALRPITGSVSVKRMAGWSFRTGVVLIALGVLAFFTNNLGLVWLGSLAFVIGLLLISPALVNPIARLFGALAALLFARDGTSSLAQSNLSRQPSRAAITASTTMIALAILVLSASAVSSIQLSFSNMLRGSLSSDYLLIPPSVTTWGMDAGAAPSLAEDLKAIDGIEVVSTLRFAPAISRDVPVGVMGIDPYAFQQTSGLSFIEGTPDTAFLELQEGRGVIVNGLVSGKAGVKIGDRMTLQSAAGTAEYQVVGIASDFLNAKTNTAYISQTNLSADFDVQEDVFFQMNIADGADTASVESQIRELIKPYPQFKMVVGQEYLDQNLALFNAMFASMIILVIFLAVPSLIAMVNTLAIGVIERRREIGILRAVGATRRQVSLVILAESLILAAIGTSFGLVSGLYLGYSTIGAIAAAGMPVEYVFPAAGVLLGIASGLVFGVLAAIIPARQAAGMQIVSALRYE